MQILRIKMCLFFITIMIVRVLTTPIFGNYMYINVYNKCRMGYRNIKADCSGLFLKEIPKKLPEEIEILDAHKNPIKRLFDNSFVNYPELKELYLQNNVIDEINAATFSRSENLKIIDLSYNDLQKVPSNVFQLPLLEKLFLEHNGITDRALDNLENTSPVKEINLSFNNLTKVPGLKSLVELKVLNLSHNSIKELTVNHLAALCSLEELYLSSNNIETMKDCDCQDLDDWLDDKNIKLDIALPCSKFQKCSNGTFSKESQSIYDNCLSTLKTRRRSRWSLLKFLMFIVVVIIVTGFFGIYVCRRNKLKKFKKKIVTPSEIIDDVSTASLNENES